MVVCNLLNSMVSVRMSGSSDSCSVVYVITSESPETLGGSQQFSSVSAWLAPGPQTTKISKRSCTLSEKRKPYIQISLGLYFRKLAFFKALHSFRGCSERKRK